MQLEISSLRTRLRTVQPQTPSAGRAGPQPVYDTDPKMGILCHRLAEFIEPRAYGATWVGNVLCFLSQEKNENVSQLPELKKHRHPKAKNE